MKKKRGTQPGNDNAYQHGFYSTVFKGHEPLGVDLMAEVELIRAMNIRFLEALKSSTEPLDPETQLSALRAVALSAHAITSLIRVHHLHASADRQMDDMMTRISSRHDAEDDDDLDTPL
jgi:hypothetical protein